MRKDSGIYLQLVFPMMDMNFENTVTLCVDLVFPLIRIKIRPKNKRYKVNLLAEAELQEQQ